MRVDYGSVCVRFYKLVKRVKHVRDLDVVGKSLSGSAGNNVVTAWISLYYFGNTAELLCVSE